jgi:hypothetical protein
MLIQKLALLSLIGGLALLPSAVSAQQARGTLKVGFRILNTTAVPKRTGPAQPQAPGRLALKLRTPAAVPAAKPRLADTRTNSSR